MSVAQMQSALELKYPERYDIPTEQRITNAINALSQSKRKEKGCSSNVQSTGRVLEIAQSNVTEGRLSGVCA